MPYNISRFKRQTKYVNKNLQLEDLSDEHLNPETLTKYMKWNKSCQNSTYIKLTGLCVSATHELCDAIRKGLVDIVENLLKKDINILNTNVHFTLSEIKIKGQAPVLVSMILSPLHLAVISCERQVIQIILKYLGFCEAKLRASICTSVTRIQLEEDDLKNTFKTPDQSLDKLNIIHLGAKYFPRALSLFIRSLDTALLSSLFAMESTLGMTPLHIAAEHSSSLGIKILIEGGISLSTVSQRGFTALHHAVRAGSEANVRLLIEEASLDINGMGCKPNYRTPLQMIRSSKMAQILCDYGANRLKLCTDLTSTVIKSTFQILLERNSEAASIILDEGISSNGKDINSSDMLLVFDMSQIYQEAELSSQYNEMNTMISISNSRDSRLISHPLIESFLHMKWTCNRKVFILNFFLYLTYVISLTTTTLISIDVSTNVSYNNSKRLYFSGSEWKSPKKCVLFTLSFTLLIFSLSLLLLKKIAKIFYCKNIQMIDSEKIIKIILYGFNIVYMISIFFDWHVISQHIGAISVFGAWMTLTLQIGRFPKIGHYVYMVFYVVDIFMWFCLVYFTILLAFAFSFCLLLPNSKLFGNPITSVLKVVAMMTGEYDFDDNFTWNEVNEQKFAANYTIQFVFILFVFIVTMIVGNLMVGLTVSETSLLLMEAKRMRLSRALEQIQGYEDIFIRGPLLSLLPQKWRPNTRIFSENSSEHCLQLCVRCGENIQHCMFSNVSPFLDYEYPVYVYDKQRKLYLEPFLGLTIPASVVTKSLKILEEREREEISLLHENPFLLNSKIKSTRSERRKSYHYSKL